MNTEVFHHINWLAILVAGLAYFFLGALWYMVLFGKKWKSYNSPLMSDPNAKKGGAGIMIISFILMLVCAFGLSLIVTRLNVSGWQVGLKLGILTGVFFGVTAIGICYVYEKKPFGLYFIDGLYTVVGNIIAAIIVSCWK
ncbi:MAG TPA: DUF1761 domain-containing protein [Hanamia sp.]|nr:DUF1761 domain-containing protein [Hanamia sp.]